MSVLLQGLIGLLFGLGLVIAGMANPAKILAFLDFASFSVGGWDPSLAFVLGGAVIAAFIGYRLVFRWDKPLFAARFHLPEDKAINQKLIIGPAIFGIGWGLIGLCPGPAFVALGFGSQPAVVFVFTMLLGMVLARYLALRQA